jgi:hypothetical protein
MGNTADTQIAKTISNERIIVTLAAGTKFYMVFTKAALPQNSAQPVRTYTEVVTSSAVRIASLVTSRDSWGIAWWSGNDALW